MRCESNAQIKVRDQLELIRFLKSRFGWVQGTSNSGITACTSTTPRACSENFPLFSSMELMTQNITHIKTVRKIEPLFNELMVLIHANSRLCVSLRGSLACAECFFSWKTGAKQYCTRLNGFSRRKTYIECASAFSNKNVKETLVTAASDQNFQKTSGGADVVRT